jgi:hypothetical protein
LATKQASEVGKRWVFYLIFFSIPVHVYPVAHVVFVYPGLQEQSTLVVVELYLQFALLPQPPLLMAHEPEKKVNGLVYELVVLFDVALFG